MSAPRINSSFSVSSAFPIKHGLGFLVMTPSAAVGQIRLDFG